ncbi:MAG: hypothetical protein PVJ67_06385 [Candidatus Pacearchaeota archaeon]|jgi:HSP20 family molecular chaperone IbpA
MFKKKKCKKCKNSVSEKHDYCPHCGNLLNQEFDENPLDFGMLGKNDRVNLGNNFGLPFGFNKMFGSLMKNLSKELNREFSQMNNKMTKPQNKKIGQNGISIKISTLGGHQPEIQIDSFGDNANNKKIIKEKPKVDLQKNFSKENHEKSLSLPKQEPSTNVKRFSDKLIYEVDIPGVKTIDDISINKFENSIEIKALTEDKVYAKIIPISLPVMNYNLTKGKLILELGEE